MEFTGAKMPANTFLTVSVNRHLRKIFFQDVSIYGKQIKRSSPLVPNFDSSLSFRNTLSDLSEEDSCRLGDS
jgi:hypothetical protein